MSLFFTLLSASWGSAQRTRLAEVVCPGEERGASERPELSRSARSPRDMSTAFERAERWVVSVASGEVTAQQRKEGSTSSTKRAFVTRAAGSGVIWGEERLILTNAHIIEAGSVIRAKTFERQVLKLRVIGIYRPLDVALLVPEEPKKLRGSSVACYTRTSPRPGVRVAAMGHPYGMPYSLSTGAISALERGESLPAWSRAFPGFIQSDLTLNPGNSGGPLLNDRGVMLGLNTAVHDSGVGMSFALPISRLLPIIEQLRDTGEFKKSYIGVKLVKMSYHRGRNASLPPRTGVRVRRVSRGGPAELSGLRKNDIILSMNGEPTNHHETLSWQLISTPADRPVILEVIRLPHPPQILYLKLIPSVAKPEEPQ